MNELAAPFPITRPGGVAAPEGARARRAHRARPHRAAAAVATAGRRAQGGRRLGRRTTAASGRSASTASASTCASERGRTRGRSRSPASSMRRASAVWRAWTEPEQLAAWWGKRGWRTPLESVTLDVRPGGVVPADLGLRRRRHARCPTTRCTARSSAGAARVRGRRRACATRHAHRPRRRPHRDDLPHDRRRERRAAAGRGRDAQRVRPSRRAASTAAQEQEPPHEHRDLDRHRHGLRVGADEGHRRRPRVLRGRARAAVLQRLAARGHPAMGAEYETAA